MEEPAQQIFPTGSFSFEEINEQNLFKLKSREQYKVGFSCPGKKTFLFLDYPKCAASFLVTLIPQSLPPHVGKSLAQQESTHHAPCHTSGGEKGINTHNQIPVSVETFL